MRCEEVRNGVGIERHDLIVGFVGVFDFLDFCLFSSHRLAFNNGGDFTKREGVSLNGEG